MADSILVAKFIPAYTGNYTNNRARYGKISEITIHHCAGVMSIEQLGALWQRKGRNGSSHYGVSGSRIGQYVAESDIAWTNSNWNANCRAVTIETSNSAGAPNWPVANASLATLILLVADIAKRNGLHPLVLGKSLTWHSMYTATACPGPYLFSKLQYIVDEANKINSGTTTAQEDANMKFLKVLSDKCEVFASPDVNAVDKSYNGGKLIEGTYYPVQAEVGSSSGYSWVRIFVAGVQRYAAVLADRCQLVTLSPGDAFAACVAQGGTSGDTSELEAQVEQLAKERDTATQRAQRAEQQVGAYLQRIESAKVALGV